MTRGKNGCTYNKKEHSFFKINIFRENHGEKQIFSRKSFANKIFEKICQNIMSSKYLFSQANLAKMRNFKFSFQLYSGRGKFMPLSLKSKILGTPGFLVTDYIKMFPL
jgi:hypothetical protein